jgi:competence protein ComEC
MTKKKIIFLILTVAILIFFSFNTTAQNLKIHFIDVGQGDSILIEEAGGKNILVDGGDSADRIAAEIINYLMDQNIKKLDYIISTHPHADHIGGLADIIDSFEVGKILDSGKIHSSMTYENYLIKIDQENIDFATPRQGDKLKIGKSEIIFLHPDQKIENYDLNNSSLVFVLKYGQQNFLFTGDIEKEVEAELLKENPNLKANVIKVPHHGSKTSSLAAWTKSLKPKLAVIQVGDNHYGHPAAEVIKLYQNQGAQVYRNDLSGNIVITADGKNYTVKVDKITDTVISKKDISQEQGSLKIDNTKLININTADISTLDKLWGVGPATAGKIIDYRKKNGHFKNIEEIKNVDGIDDGKLNHWHDKITVE